MRWVRFLIPLLLLISAQASSLQQYSEGACMLLDQQIDRFRHQPQSSNYRNAKREYERHCTKPARPVPRATQPRNDTPPVPPVAKPELSQPVKPEPTESEPLQPELTKPVLPAENAAAKVAELLLDAAPLETEDTAESQTAQDDVRDTEPVATDTGLPVALPVAVSDGAPLADTAFSIDKLTSQLVNNLPLIIANIFAFLLAVFLLTNWLGLNLPGFKGIFAEYKLNRLLRWRLARGYRHFRKLKLLTEKEELLVVDHLVLSPFGIFVIMVKGYRGSIVGEAAEANWLRQYFGSKKQFMNPLHQNFKNVEAVKHHLQLKGTDLTQHVHSVIAFSRVAQFKADMPANVTYVDTTAAYLKKFEEPCFDDEQLNRFAALLRQASTDL